MFTGVKFGTVRAYFQDIKRGIQITMTSKIARMAEKDSLSQGHIYNNPTSTTGLARVSRIDLHQLRTACYSFVFQALDERTPRSISYLFSETMIMSHSFDIQILNCNSRISQSKASAQLMQEITPSVGNLEMLSCQLETCFSSVSRAFDLSAQSSLQELQSLFSLEQMPRVSNDFAIAQSGKVLQADINANGFFREMNGFAVRQFTGKYGKPLPCPVLLDSQSLNLAFRDTMQDYGNITYLTEFKPLVRENLEARLGESDAIHSALEARKTFFLARLVFNPAEEVGESFMHSVRDILLGLRMNALKLSSKIFVAVKSTESYFAKLVDINI